MESTSELPIRVLLVDDHELLLRSLAARLDRESSIEIVGTSLDGNSAVERALESGVEVVVMDVSMPGLDCFTAARAIIAGRPSVKILFLSSHMHDEYISRALEVGAVGYMTKAEPPERIVAAIGEIARGGAFFSDDILVRLVFDGERFRLGPSRS